jgi:hypothetical protein
MRRAIASCSSPRGWPCGFFALVCLLLVQLTASQVQEVNCCEYPYAPEALGTDGCLDNPTYENTVRVRRSIDCITRQWVSETPR